MEPLSFSKSNFILLQNEKENLQKSFKIISEENERLKTQVHDMKITVRENKKVLNDYIINITKKDKLFEKLNSIIEELKEKVKKLEEKIEKNKSKDIKINYNTDDNNIQNMHLKQDSINDEIVKIKNEIKSIKEQNTLKSKINQSLRKLEENNNDNKVDDNDNNKNNDNSFISEKISDLSNSLDENDKGIRYNKDVFNLEKKYNIDIDNLTKFFTKIDENKDEVFLIDGKSNIWELIKRKDLTIDEIKIYKEVQSH
jgi:chromosome segregation protein